MSDIEVNLPAKNEENNKSVSKSKSCDICDIIICLSLIGLVLLLAYYTYLLSSNRTKGDISSRLIYNMNQRTIKTQGYASEEIYPDWATVRLAITAQSESARQASAQVNAQMNRIINALQTSQNLGIRPRDIRTSEYSISPIYSSNQPPLPSPPNVTNLPSTSIPGPNTPQRIIGYTATQEITVLIRSPQEDQRQDSGEFGTLIGTVLDLAIQNGANVIPGITFQVSPERQEAVLEILRKNAIKNAYSIANQEASAAGVKLGDVINIEGISPRPFVSTMYAQRYDIASAEVAQIQPGTQTISTSVSVTYKIL